MIQLAVLAPMLLAPTLAQACHHYSRWYYPYPQPRCGLAAHTTRPKEVDRSWYVEIVLPDVDPDRERGLEELKEKLK